MPFIPVDTSDVHERRPVVNGKYEVTILEVDTDAKTKEGKPQWVVNIAINGYEDKAPNLRHYIGIPSDKDTPEQKAFKKLNIARFQQLFGLRTDGLDDEQMVGTKAQVEITLTEPDDQGRQFNRLNLPYLKEGGGAKAPAAAKPPKR